VNREADVSQLHKMSIRHFDKVGVLAHVFAVFSTHGYNVQELENIVFKQREACVVNILFTGSLDLMAEVTAQIKNNTDVIDVSV
jgi:D-3-phosphoglycerate dehydrogenase